MKARAPLAFSLPIYNVSEIRRHLQGVKEEALVLFDREEPPFEIGGLYRDMAREDFCRLHFLTTPGGLSGDPVAFFCTQHLKRFPALFVVNEGERLFRLNNYNTEYLRNYCRHTGTKVFVFT